MHNARAARSALKQADAPSHHHNRSKPQELAWGPQLPRAAAGKGARVGRSLDMPKGVHSWPADLAGGAVAPAVLVVALERSRPLGVAEDAHCMPVALRWTHQGAGGPVLAGLMYGSTATTIKRGGQCFCLVVQRAARHAPPDAHHRDAGVCCAFEALNTRLCFGRWLSCSSKSRG
jgi:hypothetical protein